MKHLVAVAAAISLAGCVSLKESVERSSLDYGSAMRQFADEQTLTNVLLARDHKPMHFAELGQITGSLTVGVQLQSTVPFGKNYVAGMAVNTIQPQVTFSSAPTFQTSPLDTEAFIVGMLQPVEFPYFVALWQEAGNDKDLQGLLFFLFVDTFNKEGNSERYDQILDRGALGELDFKVATVLTRIGQPFCLDLPVPASAALAASAASAPTGYKISDLLANVDDVTVHMAELKSRCGISKEQRQYQLYRIWRDQPVICGEPPDHDRGLSTPQASASATQLRPDAAAIPSALPNLRANMGKSIANLRQALPPQAANRTAHSQAGGANFLSAPQLNVTVAQCNSDRIDLDDPQSDLGWVLRMRSPKGVFDAVGRIARASIPSRSATKTYFNLQTVETAPVSGASSSIFVRYGDQTYVASGSDSDYTLRVVSMLEDLVNSRKLSSDIPATKQVQVIP